MADHDLVLEGLSSGYGETVILEGIDLNIGDGEHVSIVGRNGAGKTTLLATIMGHATLHKGRVALGGRDLSRAAIHRRVTAGLGLVPQEREIFPSLSVMENLQVARRPGRWTEDTVFDLFPRLRERIGHRGNQLSGGEQQMLAIGRALMGNPRVLLLDEPSEGLAPVIVEQLMEALTRLVSEGGITILLVEQNTHIALEFAERTIVMLDGRVAFDDKSAILYNDSALLDSLVGVADTASTDDKA